MSDEGNVTLRHIEAAPFITPPRYVTVGDLIRESVRVIPGTTRMVGLVRDTGSAWR